MSLISNRSIHRLEELKFPSHLIKIVVFGSAGASSLKLPQNLHTLLIGLNPIGDAEIESIRKRTTLVDFSY